MLPLSKCPALLVLGVILTACGAAPLTVATRPDIKTVMKSAPKSVPDPTHAPKLHPILPPRRARVAPKRWLVPTPTTTSAPPAAQVVPPPRVQQGPTPISTRRCTGAVEAEIERVFGPAAPWASSVVWRESNCTPGARNREGASGLFQMILPLHADLFLAVGCNPLTQWSDVTCNVAAAYRLYLGSGTAPWAL